MEGEGLKDGGLEGEDTPRAPFVLDAFVYRAYEQWADPNFGLRLGDIEISLGLGPRNSAGEFVRVSGNWHANELTCPTSPRDVGRDQPPLAACARKRPRTTNQPPRRPEETLPRIPPASTQAVMVIRESTSGARLAVQAAHLAYMMEDKLRDAAEEDDKERALKEVAKAMVKDKDKAVENVEERIRAAERARALVEQRVEELEVKLGGTELKLAEAKSLNSASAKEIAELNAALEASEDKWYNTGFADTQNSVKPIIYKSRRYGGHGVKEADPNGVNLLFVYLFYEIVLLYFSKSDLSDENTKVDVVKVYWLA
ncbi:hypothetical protein SO802_028296 [Lithocarpus litseifolius]|uniref:Uncharacterized protein n=1 Tax=Lithocarpus litseifolius TaxID=425828 RepID=A0AAW2BS52_9ROSI